MTGAGARTRAVACLLILGLGTFLSPPVAPGATPAQVDQAVAKARDYLYSKQKDGNWEQAPARDPTTKPSDTEGGQWGGITALCTYALLAAGERHDEPRIAGATQFLLRADMIGVYALGMRASVWNLLPRTAEIKQAINKDMRLLRAAMKDSGAARGFYDYTDNSATRFDHSVSQYGVLGMWACAENIEGVGQDYWKIVDEAWRRDQRPSGAWCYYRAPGDRHGETIAMTTAGVATLFITTDFLARAKSLDAAGNERDEDIERGIKWINENYKKLYESDKTQSHHPYYSLYGIERIGVASGYKFLGGVDWYDSGADYLIKGQGKDGKWGNVIDTSLALLFLSRGRAPVVMNKLEYSVTTGGSGAVAKTAEGNWNQRPRDAANLAKFVGRQSERALNWQIVNLKAPVDELHDSPILYISGSEPLALPDDQRQKIRQFVEEGGLVLAHADAGNRAFAESVRKLGTELFKYEFRPLPATHVIFTDEQFPASKWKRKPNVLGLSNGVRELILLIPDGDPARYWQAYDVAGRSEWFELIANVFQYSIDKQNLRNKGETYIVRTDGKAKPSQTIKLARLEYGGNFDPEPGGWKRLAAVMRNSMKTTLELQTVPIRKLSVAAADVKVAHLTGTGAFKLDQAEQGAIKQLVTGGGVLIVDSAGGSREFVQSVEHELETIFGPESAKALSEPVPADHPIYRRGGTRLEIAYRAYAQRNLTGDLHKGRLRIMQLKGKPAVIYSPEDLSFGLVGAPVDGVLGYEPKTATALMSNILLTAAGK